MPARRRSNGMFKMLNSFNVIKTLVSKYLKLHNFMFISSDPANDIFSLFLLQKVLFNNLILHIML